MNYGDLSKAITAEDIIRRYNLDNLRTDRKTIKKIAEDLTNTNTLINNFADAVTKDINELQNQVDGNIATWFFNGVPNLENSPANEWLSEEEKNNHLGDLYYDQDTGYAYRFALKDGKYQWLEIKDTDVTKALALANSAQDTADRKRTTFVDTPSPPYEVGDLWVKEDKELYRCRAKRTEGEFQDVDWVLATDYSNDDYAKNVEAVLNQFKATVEKDYTTNVQLETTRDSILGQVEAITTEIVTVNNERYEYYDSQLTNLNINVGNIELSITEINNSLNDNFEKLSSLELDIDSITGKVAQIDEQNEKISQVTQTVDELNSKIQNIADITVSNSTLYGSLELDNINASEPINIGIRPIGEDISYLYPNENLFPSEDLFMKERTLRFHNKKTDENIDYELPDDLLYYDANNYDEFKLDYDTNTCQIIKKVEYNADGTKRLLTLPETRDYEYPTINLTDGDYEIILLGYESAYLSVRLMASNIYTTQFATRVELNNSIIQAKDSITFSITEMLDNEYFTGAKIMMEINNDESGILIQADKIKLEGYTTINEGFGVNLDGSFFANEGTIGGWHIDDYSLVQTSLTGNDLVEVKLNGYGNNPSKDSWLMSISGYTIINNEKFWNDTIFTIDFSGKIFTVNDIECNGLYASDVHYENLVPTSLEDKKKNFKKLNNALSIIEDIDIYKYNFKKESDNYKQHIGMVIGKNYKYSSEITALDENNKEVGVDLYSMTSLNTQAIKELLERIKVLERKVKNG